MSTSKHIDKVCCVVLALVLILTAVFVNAEQFGVTAVSAVMGYEQKLFDTARVHTIDIVMDDWEGFLDTCENEEYELCSVVIDNEAYKNVGIRAKGNTSLSMVSKYGNDRYSFKIEFDHYDNGKTYYGLDKLSLNNVIQDNTYMKDYLTYQMMGYFGVSAPLCSYVYITINGEEWGLYLAVEGVEESFLERNYGSNYGQLYKPDSMNMGGGRGNGGNFDMDRFREEKSSDKKQNENTEMSPGGEAENELSMPDGEAPPAADGENRMELPDRDVAPENGAADKIASGQRSVDKIHGNGMGGRTNEDVSLIYTDDDPDSYSNIFDQAKTDITDADKERLIKSLKAMNEGTSLSDVVNIDEVIRYFVVHNFVCNFDSYTGSMIHNYYLYEENGQMSMIPWDYNLAFGGFQSQSDADGLVNYPIDTPVSGGDTDSRPMLAWILNSEEYTETYHQYFTEFIASYFESGYFAEMIDTVSSMIAPYVSKDPTKFCTYGQFETGVATLKQFCLLRAESIRGQLQGTIPATDEGQKQDSSSFIDASSITISDMGSMGNEMGDKPGNEDKPGGRPDQESVPHNGNESGSLPGQDINPENKIDGETVS